MKLRWQWEYRELLPEPDQDQCQNAENTSQDIRQVSQAGTAPPHQCLASESWQTCSHISETKEYFSENPYLESQKRRTSLKKMTFHNDDFPLHKTQTIWDFETYLGLGPIPGSLIGKLYYSVFFGFFNNMKIIHNKLTPSYGRCNYTWNGNFSSSLLQCHCATHRLRLKGINSLWTLSKYITYIRLEWWFKHFNTKMNEKMLYLQKNMKHSLHTKHSSC